MKNSNDLYSRKYMLFIGFVLFVTGICVAIIFLPTIPILAFLLFALIGGPGIFIAYKRKKARLMLFGTLLIVGWGYAGASLFMFRQVDNEFWGRFLFPMFLLAGLATLPLAWFARLEPRKTEHSSFESASITWILYMFVTVPLVFAFAWDYNIRGDTSPTEVVSLKIVSKYIAHHDEGDSLELQVETLDGRSVFFLYPSESFYDEHEKGDLVEATAHRGALGGMWLEGYR